MAYVTSSIQPTILSLIASYRNGSRKAFSSIVLLLNDDIERIAKRYALFNEGRGNYEEDFAQECRLGLLTAVETFDESKGSFRSYAIACMTNAVRGYIKEGMFLIGLKANVTDNISKINKGEKSLLAKGISNPTLEELKEASGIQSKKTFDNAIAGRKATMVTFLDKTMGDGEEEHDSYLSVFASSFDLEEEFLSQEEERKLLSLIKSMGKDDQTILVLTYGLFGFRKCTNDEISRKVGLSEVSIISHRKKALSALERAFSPWAA